MTRDDLTCFFFDKKMVLCRFDSQTNQNALKYSNPSRPELGMALFFSVHLA